MREAGSEDATRPNPERLRDPVARWPKHQRSARARRVRSGPKDRVGADRARQRRETQNGRDRRLGVGSRHALDRAPDRTARRSIVLHPGAAHPRQWLVGDRRPREAATARCRAGVRRRFAPHQLRHAHAIEMAHEGIPLPIIQSQLGHAHLGIASIYLQGIDTREIVDAVHRRRPPVIPASAGLRR